MGHMHWQNDEQKDAVGAWVASYKIAHQIGYAQVLQALDNLAAQLGQTGGISYWASLAHTAEE